MTSGNFYVLLRDDFTPEVPAEDVGHIGGRAHRPDDADVYRAKRVVRLVPRERAERDVSGACRALHGRRRGERGLTRAHAAPSRERKMRAFAVALPRALLHCPRCRTGGRGRARGGGGAIGPRQRGERLRGRALPAWPLPAQRRPQGMRPQALRPGHGRRPRAGRRRDPVSAQAARGGEEDLDEDERCICSRTSR